MPRRSPSAKSVTPDLPPHFRHVFRAAARECPKGHAQALRDLTALAVRKVPSRGIFDPASRGDHELFTAIDVIARRHLGQAQARASWKAAVRGAALEFADRERIERAALHVQGVSDTAYFYAGLAFGLTWLSVYRDR
ncbi:MAG TPA: hypothetical protein VFK57_09635 [Vicinamibacterales bacterium]|nr:hypothetical protein [Vicinamibacterales bacterium]